MRVLAEINMEKHQTKRMSAKKPRYFSLLKNLAKTFVRRQADWSIGIYTGESPANFVSPKNFKNPVLTAKDVTDVPADFIADPFMVSDRGSWYMFFEVLNGQRDKGEIALATSNDGYSWDYQKIVLSEPFHLSYPYVFRFQDEYYMIPESYEANSVRLYKAIDFPTQWTLVKTLLDGSDYVDSSIFQFNDQWWLFTTCYQSNILRLYYADDLMGNWMEHPQSPVIKGNINIVRPGGRVLVHDGKIFRYTQDGERFYGNQVRAFEITNLTTTNYEEKPVPGNPIIKGSGFGWNKTGMHTIDPHHIGDGKWIACVDGYRIVTVFGLELDFFKKALNFGAPEASEIQFGKSSSQTPTFK